MANTVLQQVESKDCMMWRPPKIDDEYLFGAVWIFSTLALWVVKI